MNIGDFLLCTVQGNTASPLTNYVAEITSLDPVNEFFSCRWVDTGGAATFIYSSNNGPWYGTNEDGTDFAIDTHNIYSPAAQDPSPQDVAVVTFADNNRYLGYVENVSPTNDVIFYHSPYPRLSFNFTDITASDWDWYPAGGQIISIERYVLNNEIAAPVNHGVFNNGWWSLATRRDAHPQRIGGLIDPFSTVVHTTDMVPESWNGLLNRWTTEPGEPGRRNCAHFAIGRDASAGVVQFAPITRDAHHTGGGRFVAGTASWGSNSVSVGIEVHCAGDIQQVNGQWRHMELVPYGDPVPAVDVDVPDPQYPNVGEYNGVRAEYIDTEWRLMRHEPRGNPIPATDVVLDSAHPGRGWHTVTDYQYQQLGTLLDCLETVLLPLPLGCVAQPTQGQVPHYGLFPTGRVVGHVSLTPRRRGDPWPPTCNWLRAR